MSLRCLFVLFLCISLSLAIRCYNGQQTVGEPGDPFIGAAYNIVDCTDADFCYDNYVKRHHRGDNSYTITKSCGEPGKCFETGCEGPGDDKNCCCIGDLCNSSNGLSLGVAGIIAIIYRLL